MCRRMALVNCVTAVLLGVGPGIAAAPVGDRSDGKPIPSFAEVRRTVLEYFEEQPDFKSGDLITRDEVAPLLSLLKKQGLPLADAKEILKKTPAKGEFLVDQLSTKGGRKFMRQISAYPNAYDRLDRLGRLPHGKQTVRDLIRGPGGEKMIEYMTTTQGGKELGKQLSNAPDGKRFNRPTGRIYTMALLLDQLEQSRTAALKAAAKSRGKTQ